MFRENIEKMEGYTPGYQPTDSAAVKLNTNENPYPPSPKVIEAIRQVDAESLRRYPPILWDSFRQAGSEILDVAPQSIVCGNGGDEILTVLIRCCCDQNRPLIYPALTYSLYSELATIQNCPAIEIPYDDYNHLPKKLYNTDAGLTIICNPNAPTGTLVAIEEIAQLAGAVKGVLLIDEAYIDFAPQNCLELLKRFNNIAILRSMSKGYSLAGMRFGFAIASEPIVGAMLKVKDSYNLSIVAQAAATAAIKDQPYFKKNTQAIIAQRNRLIKELPMLGFDVNPSQANFILVKTTNKSAREIYDLLCKQNIFVRYFNTSGLTDKLRISIGTPDQNDRLLRALADIMGH